ncbi:hypothetical protein VTN49DRAFT_5070 [Thermomyces lanuginosus]|uniref:uncharacterized protein n=1 Tax=Thermomyces lanuginosus TaxID=5541 RepID=UPI003744B0CB
MPVFTRLVSVVLRLGEITFATIVAGIIGYYLQRWDEGYGDRLGDYLGRWIYSEVIAGLSILLGLLWLIPTAHTFFIWPIDVVISFAWFAVFGLVVDALDDVPCGGVFDWDRGTINFDNFCGHWRAAEAFSFLSAIIWLVSGILGIYFVWRVEHRTRPYGRYHV